MKASAAITSRTRFSFLTFNQSSLSSTSMTLLLRMLCRSRAILYLLNCFGPHLLKAQLVVLILLRRLQFGPFTRQQQEIHVYEWRTVHIFHTSVRTTVSSPQTPPPTARSLGHTRRTCPWSPSPAVQRQIHDDADPREHISSVGRAVLLAVQRCSMEQSKGIWASSMTACSLAMNPRSLTDDRASSPIGMHTCSTHCWPQQSTLSTLTLSSMRPLHGWPLTWALKDSAPVFEPPRWRPTAWLLTPGPWQTIEPALQSGCIPVAHTTDHHCRRRARWHCRRCGLCMVESRCSLVFAVSDFNKAEADNWLVASDAVAADWELSTGREASDVIGSDTIATTFNVSGNHMYLT